jgi:hypothetical protein
MVTGFQQHWPKASQQQPGYIIPIERKKKSKKDFLKFCSWGFNESTLQYTLSEILDFHHSPSQIHSPERADIQYGGFPY